MSDSAKGNVVIAVIILVLIAAYLIYNGNPVSNSGLSELQLPPQDPLETLTSSGDPAYNASLTPINDEPPLDFTLQPPLDPPLYAGGITGAGIMPVNPYLPPIVLPTFDPAQPQLAGEAQWLAIQASAPGSPNAAITRVSAGVNSFNATGVWSLRGYIPPFAPTITWDSDSSYDYTGHANGHMNGQLSPTMKVYVYSCTDQAYEQFDTSNDSGSWTCTNVFPGDKIAVIVDSSNHRIVATSEDTVSFDANNCVESISSIDSTEVAFSSPLGTDGTYTTSLLLDYIAWDGNVANIPLLGSSFPASSYISKLVPILNPGNVVYAQTSLFQGLIKSFEVPTSDPDFPFIGNRGYSYDQALWVNAASAIDLDLMDAAVLSLCEVQQTESPYAGMWFFSWDTTTGVSSDPYFRCGAQAWCIQKLCDYVTYYPTRLYVSNAKTAITAGLTALLSFQQTSGPQAGLVQLGLGEYDGDTFEPGTTNPVVFQASTEHNIDTWFALQLANKIFPGTYATQRDACKSGLVNALWGQNIYGIPVFCEGISPAGVIDTNDALDINSWGGLWWIAQSDADAVANATLCYSNCQAFFYDAGFVSGYQPYLSTRGYPDTISNVWSEGTQGVALLAFRLGIKETPGGKPFGMWEIIDNMIYLRQANGGWQYSFLDDTVNELTNFAGVSGTAWSEVNLTPSLRDSMMVS